MSPYMNKEWLPLGPLVSWIYLEVLYITVIPENNQIFYLCFVIYFSVRIRNKYLSIATLLNTRCLPSVAVTQRLLVG